MDTVRLRIETPGRPVRYRFVRIPHNAELYSATAEALGWHDRKREINPNPLWFLSCSYVVSIERLTEKDEK